LKNITANFSSITKEARTQWNDIFKMVKKKQQQKKPKNPINLNSKISLKTEGKIKLFR
jgi:hypothetical protein